MKQAALAIGLLALIGCSSNLKKQAESKPSQKQDSKLTITTPQTKKKKEAPPDKKLKEQLIQWALTGKNNPILSKSSGKAPAKDSAEEKKIEDLLNKTGLPNRTIMYLYSRGAHKQQVNERLTAIRLRRKTIKSIRTFHDTGEAKHLIAAFKTRRQAKINASTWN